MSKIVPEELINDALRLLQEVKSIGKIKKGTNEVTKAIERGKARLVFIGEDVTPAEITRHLPILSSEKKIPFLVVPQAEKLGQAAGIEVPAASVAIVDASSAEAELKSINERVKQFN